MFCFSVAYIIFFLQMPMLLDSMYSVHSAYCWSGICFINLEMDCIIIFESYSVFNHNIDTVIKGLYSSWKPFKPLNFRSPVSRPKKNIYLFIIGIVPSTLFLLFATCPYRAHIFIIQALLLQQFCVDPLKCKSFKFQRRMVESPCRIFDMNLSA